MFEWSCVQSDDKFTHFDSFTEIDRIIEREKKNVTKWAHSRPCDTQDTQITERKKLHTTPTTTQPKFQLFEHSPRESSCASYSCVTWTYSVESKRKKRFVISVHEKKKKNCSQIEKNNNVHERNKKRPACDSFVMPVKAAHGLSLII